MTEQQLAQLNPFRQPQPLSGDAGGGSAGVHSLRHAVWLYFTGLQTEHSRAVRAHEDLRAGQAKIDLWLVEEQYPYSYCMLWDRDLPLFVAGDDLWQCLYGSGLPAFIRPFYRAPRTLGDRVLYAAALLDTIAEYWAGKRSDFLLALRLSQHDLARLRSRTHALQPGDNYALFARFAAVYDFFFSDQPV